MGKDPRPRGPELRALGEGEPAGADADGRVDVETAQRMVQAAVLQAVQREDKAAAIVQAKAAAATRRAARHNLLLGAGIAAALVAAFAAAIATYQSRRAAELLSTEVGLGGTARAPTGSIPKEVVSGRAIFEQNKGAIFVMGYTLGDRVGGCCSAFAIAPDLLATNAHCVLACGARGGTPTVTPNDADGRTRFKILGMTTHPGYRKGSQGADSPDVGLLRIAGKAPRVVTIASDAELRAIGPGDDAYVIGFPGRVMDPVSPSATFLQGRIGRVTGLGEQAAPPERAVLIQHDAVTRGGNSGSPIFNQYGHVIGVHAAHIDEEDDVSIGGQTTKVVRSSPFRLGMRIDLLQEVPRP
jgi:hypothetical protein